MVTLNMSASVLLITGCHKNTHSDFSSQSQEMRQVVTSEYLANKIVFWHSVIGWRDHEVMISWTT